MKLNWKLFAPLVVAILVWLIGAPEGLSANSWIYVSIFAGLVVGLILEPMPPAFIGIIAVTVSMLFKVGIYKVPATLSNERSDTMIIENHKGFI